MSLYYETTSFPKNMSYHMDVISNYSKQPIRISCDRTGDIGPSETIKFKLPNNTLVDLDSLSWYFDFTATQPTSGARFFPRNSHSIIDALYVYANGQLIDPCNYYNHLANTLTDATCGFDYHKSGVRYLENTDPSVREDYNTGTGAITTELTTAVANTAGKSDTDRPLVVRNWLGFLGTASTRVIDTGLLGDVVIEIRLAEPSITYISAGTGAPSYKINGSSTYMTITRIVFGNATYTDLLSSIVSSTGLQIGYNSYTSHRGNAYTKAVNTFVHSFNVNANHLTKLIATLVPSTYQTEGTLISADLSKSWAANNFTGFNQSKYFQKDAKGLKDVQWDINGISQYPQPLSKFDIFNQNLIALNMDSDIQSGCHSGCSSIGAFLNWYFVNILSFEHIQNTNEFVLQGFDGKASAISCKWTMNYEGAAGSTSVFPLIFAENQKVLSISAGQQLLVM